MLRFYHYICVKDETLSDNNIGVITVTKLHDTDEYYFQNLDPSLGELIYC